MGMSRWSDSDWAGYTSTVKNKTIDEVFTSRKIAETFDPKNITLCESRDSDINPNSTAIIAALDVTGSMGENADILARQGLGVMVSEILKRKPVSDPHIMCMAIGDVRENDKAPLQVTQFEADIKIAKQLESLYLERGGGGNSTESYNLAWHFAALHTSIDCHEIHQRKGYLFTIGDEEPQKGLLASEIRRVYGNEETQDYTNEQLLNMAAQKYHIYHIIVEQSSHARMNMDSIVKAWNKEIGSQRVLRLVKNEDLAEVIVSAIQVNEGEHINDVVNSWSPDKAISISKAVGGIVPYKDGKSGKGIVKF